jgi:hypothetical protein
MVKTGINRMIRYIDTMCTQATRLQEKSNKQCKFKIEIQDAKFFLNVKALKAMVTTKKCVCLFIVIFSYFLSP